MNKIFKNNLLKYGLKLYIETKKSQLNRHNIKWKKSDWAKNLQKKLNIGKTTSYKYLDLALKYNFLTENDFKKS